MVGRHFMNRMNRGWSCNPGGKAEQYPHSYRRVVFPSLFSPIPSPLPSPLPFFFSPLFPALLLLLLLLACLAAPVAAQDEWQSESPVEIVTGTIEPESGHQYLLPGLTGGDTLYVYMEGTSGNLDPFIGVSGSGFDRRGLNELFLDEAAQAIAAGGDPLVIIPQFNDRYFLAWDDDSGTGYSAVLAYTLPYNGDYTLLATNSPASLNTFGEFRLTVGINAPEVMNGTGVATGDTIAVLDRKASELDRRVDEVEGTLSPEKPETFHFIRAVAKGDTLYARVDVLPGEPVPALLLTDIGGKPFSADIPKTGANSSTLQFTFSEDHTYLPLFVIGDSTAAVNTTVDYHLLVGTNDPDVLSGTAEETPYSLLDPAVPVLVGFELDQITTVDQKSENFGVVGNIWMSWTDPALGFDPVECDCPFKVYRSIDEFVSTEGVPWPEFTLFNQQERRWTQNTVISLMPDGTATYYERFWVILQAPDFNFKWYPFDNQQFYVRIDSLYPEEFYFYEPWDEKTAVGGQLGEEEWYITDHGVTIDSVNINTHNSRFSFGFHASRHLTYYLLRILMPIFIIIILGWVPFLLTDYAKRADLAGANLLLFIAFNFTIASDLPRLGYLTFLDVILVTTFVVSGLEVIYNLYMSWLATKKQKEYAQRIDKFMAWFYPFAYVIILGVSFIIFP